MKKTLIGLAIAAVILAVIYQAFVIWYQTSATRDHHQHLEYLHSIGESLEVDEHRPAAIDNESDNFASAKVISDLIEQARHDGSDWEPPVHVKDIPGYERITKARKRVRYMESPALTDSFAGLASDEEASKSILAYCKTHQELLSAFSKASSRPLSNMEMEYEKGFAMLSPELKIFQDIAQLLFLRGKAYQITGEHESAAEDALTLIRLQSHLRQEPSLINQLLSTAILDFGIQLISNGLREHSWSDDQLILFEKELANVHLAETTLKAFRMERAIFTLTMRQLVDDGEREEKLKQMNIPFVLRKSSGTFRAWQYDNIRKFSEIIQAECLSDDNGRPVHSEFPDEVAFIDATRELTGSTLRRFRYLMVTIALPAYGTIINRAKRAQFYADSARIGIAMERYFLKNGNYPGTPFSHELAPLLSAPIPLDPFSDEPLKFQLRADNHYQFYSIGPNRKDESGLHRRDIEEGDWIWTLKLPDDFDREAYFERSRQ